VHTLVVGDTPFLLRCSGLLGYGSRHQSASGFVGFVVDPPPLLPVVYLGVGSGLGVNEVQLTDWLDELRLGSFFVL
jgi:hypothetical protein